MKKVFQTRVSSGDGNCTEACVASIFDMELNEVPEFGKEEQFWKMIKFFEAKGYDLGHVNLGNGGTTTDHLKAIAEFDGGVNGLFLASVKSKTLDGTHCIVVDKNLQVVHDPNPNQKCIGLPPEKILGIDVVTDFTYQLYDDGSISFDKK